MNTNWLELEDPDGLDLFGVGTVIPSAAKPSVDSKFKEKAKAVGTKIKNMVLAVGVSGGAGAVVGGSLGALLWKSHRLIGGLGGAVAGAGAGFGTAYAIERFTDKSSKSVEKKKHSAVGFDYMSLLSGAGGALSGMSGGGKGKTAEQQKLEDQKAQAEKSAATMKMVLIAGGAVAGALGLTYLVRK